MPSRVQITLLAAGTGLIGVMIGWLARGPGHPSDASDHATPSAGAPVQPTGAPQATQAPSPHPAPAAARATPPTRPPRDPALDGNVEPAGGPPLADGVHETVARPGAWIVRSGDVTLYVTYTAEGAPDPSPAYVIPQLTADQSEALAMRRRILTNKALRDALKITPAQLAQLREFAAFRGVDYPPADRARIIALFKAWRKAQPATAPVGPAPAAAADPPPAAELTPAQSAAEAALLTVVAEIAAKSPPPKSGYEPKLVERAFDVLTAEQVKAYQDGSSLP